MPGADTDVAVALHPIKGWAAVIWAHTPPDEPNNGAVFVRTQDAATGIWQTGISVNTTPTYGFAGHPDVAVDPAGRIHVVFAQTYNGHKLYPHYSRSEDGGKTWSAPEPLPTPDWSNQSAGYSQIAVDPQGQLHIFFTVGTGQLDRYRYVEVQRPSAAAPGSAWRIESNIFGGDKETRIALAFVPYERDAVRTVAVTGCNHGCGYAQPIVAIRDGYAGAWRKATIPQAVLPGDLQINWVSAVSFVQPRGQYVVCVAWGLYGRSGTFASCSRDQGATWEAAQPIIQTPSAIDNQTYDTGSTPELL